MVEGWAIGLAANAIIATAYLAVAALLAVNAIRSNQWRTNTLGLATTFLYITCGGGHAVYALQLLDVALGRATPVAAGAAYIYGGWPTWTWDIVTAGVGVWYWTMRGSFPTLVTGTAVFEDLRLKQRRAVEINDNIVQGLARAKLSLELERDEEGKAALDDATRASHRVLDEMSATGRRPT